MIKTLFLVIFIFLSGFTLFAQTKNDSIVINKHFWNNDYFINNQEFSRSDIVDILNSNPASKDLMSISSTEKTWGFITMVSGVILTYKSFLEIFKSHNNFGQGPTSNEFILGSALAIGLDISSIVLFSKSKINFRSAINKYNQNLDNKSSGYDSKLNLNIGLNRIGFTYDF